MSNLTEEQIQLYQAFSRLMPGDQFVSSSGTVAVIEAIQRMIDASLLKDKAQSVNNAESVLKIADDAMRNIARAALEGKDEPR